MQDWSDDSGSLIRLAPSALAEEFFRLDRGDESRLRDLDILIDLPCVLSVARMHFASGTGYEVIFSTAVDVDDCADAIKIVGSANLIHCAPHGANESGRPQMRALYWERKNIFE